METRIAAVSADINRTKSLMKGNALGKDPNVGIEERMCEGGDVDYMIAEREPLLSHAV